MFCKRDLLCEKSPPPKNGLIALWPSTNGAIPYFLVLPGSELSITEITKYTYFSQIKPCREFRYECEYCTSGSYYWTHFVFVKQNIYILLHACSATVRLLHSWADKRDYILQKRPYSNSCRRWTSVAIPTQSRVTHVKEPCDNKNWSLNPHHTKHETINIS